MPLDLLCNFLRNEIPMEIAEVAEAITAGIALRGLFALMDEERLDLIGGADTLKRLETCEVMQKVAAFAAANGWYITRTNVGLVFRLKAGDGAPCGTTEL
jgi:hypothetical protein